MNVFPFSILFLLSLPFSDPFIKSKNAKKARTSKQKTLKLVAVENEEDRPNEKCEERKVQGKDYGSDSYYAKWVGFDFGFGVNFTDREGNGV